MSTEFQTRQESYSSDQKRIVALQLVTIACMCLEAAIAVAGALAAHSVALLAFGADSGIELISAVVVYLRFTKRSAVSERSAARVAGWLLVMLAAGIVVDSVIAISTSRLRPERSYLGIGALIAAALIMPWLAREKRALALKTGSAALKADAVQNSMCTYLAWIALAGLVLNALFGLSVADPIAALLLLPIIVREAFEAIQGTNCSGGG